jgi:hypothetical protein
MAELIRCAWIDHTGAYDTLFGMRIACMGVDITSARKLEEFRSTNNLNDFSVLLYHAGIGQHHNVPRVIRENPTLNIAFLTLGEGPFESKISNGRELAVLPYIQDQVYGFILRNQRRI